MLEPEVLQLATAGTTLAARAWGAREAPPVVFLHGLNVYSNALALNEAADVLAGPGGFRVLAPDAPGVGQSPSYEGDYSPPDLARVYLGALGRAEISPAAFVGFSWGAAVAVEAILAARDRIPAVVLVDGAYWALRDSPVFSRFVAEGEQALEQFAFDEWEELRWESEEGWLAWLAEATGSELRPALRRTALAAVGQRDGAIRPRASARMYATAIRELFQWDDEAALRRLGDSPARVLLLAAHDETPFGRMRQEALPRFRALVPQAQVVPLEGPHDLFLTDAAAVGGRIRTWLRNERANV